MKRLRLLVIAMLLIAVPAGCGGSDSYDDGDTLVIIDNDGAFDDIKAILYLLQQPDVEVLALTVSGTGIARCPTAANNTAALLERIAAPEIPVACGRSAPLEGNNAAPAMWRDSADTLGAVELPEPPESVRDDAAKLLIETIKDAPRPVILVALGPLTNVAEALQDEPDLLDEVEMIYLMGGAVDAGGNVFFGNPAAEFNIWADPTAAAAVFATDVPITLVPLDATNHLPVTPYLYEAVAAHQDASPVASFVADYLDATPLFGGMYHWDELAAVAAIDDSVVTTEERMLSVTTGSPDQAGATVDDPNGRAVRVATSASRPVFEAHFYEAILGVADPGVPAWEPDAVLSWDGTECVYTGPDPLPASFYIRLDNSGSELVAFVTGAYDAGTTRAEFDEALAAANPDIPEWWLPSNEVVAPVGAQDVWHVRGGDGLTALCYVGPGQIWEVAGPRLPDG